LTLARDILNRLARLEENERLTSRVSTEKKDQIFPNLTYPDRDADEELVRRANVALQASIKSVERRVVYLKDPYNWIMWVALEANKVRAVHRLSKEQQRELVINTIPSSDPDHAYFCMADNLDDLYQVISVLATQILTISDLEKAINSWTLDNSTTNNMYKSLTSLMDLLQRSMEHRNRDQPVELPELFRQAITRIQRDPNLPSFINTKLNEARLRIRDVDKLPELNQILLGSLNAYIGMKPKNDKRSANNAMPKNSKIQHSKVFALEYAPIQVSSPVLHDSCAPPKGQQSHGNKGKPKVNSSGNAQKQPQQPQQQQKPQNQGNQPMVDGTGKPPGNGKGKPKKFTKIPSKYKFVQPWPEDKPYLSKAGNALSKECEDHFNGYCFRCGHSSHTGDTCRIYPDKTVYITLCAVCRQGFHDSCKSKRWGAKEAYVNKKLNEVTYMLNCMAIGGQQRLPSVPQPGVHAIRRIDDSSDSD
jgi:hypothetical protein